VAAGFHRHIPLSALQSPYTDGILLLSLNKQMNLFQATVSSALIRDDKRAAFFSLSQKKESPEACT